MNKHLIICENCDKEFYFNFTESHPTRRFCSWKCLEDFRSKSWKKFICQYCKKEFVRYTWKGKLTRKFCSRSCSRKWQARFPETNPCWKGGKRILPNGYIYIRVENHPFINKRIGKNSGYIFEHRLVMEKILGRYLKPNEFVHHINRNKSDNRPENLKLVMKSTHYDNFRCPKCGFRFSLK